MITAATQTPLRDAMYAMSLAKPIPDAELLDDFVRRYPQHADALTEFAIELAIDALMDRDTEQDIPVDPDTISPVVSRVMSQFQNRLYGCRQARTATPPARAATAFVANPFAPLDRAGFRALASRIDVNAAMLSKLRDRQIAPVTIPKRFCTFVADEMDIPEEALTAHLFAVPEISQARQFYKAEGKPVATARQSFEQAVQNSGLSEEQQRRLLSFRD
jgi:hypothetical protein